MTLSRRHLVAAVAALPALRLGPAQAHSYRHAGIDIGHAWAPPGTEATAAYVAIVNTGAAPDRLVAAATPAAEATVLRDGDGAALDGIDLAPGRGANLRPGGPHLALEGLAAPLATGARIPLTLRFAVAGEVGIEVWIEPSPYDGG